MSTIFHYGTLFVNFYEMQRELYRKHNLTHLCMCICDNSDIHSFNQFILHILSNGCILSMID